MTGLDEDAEEDGAAGATNAAAADGRKRLQYAALPYRIADDGDIEVLLITSRTTRRWIIPKGWPMGKLPPRKVAATEAEEEAGVAGRISRQPIGSYSYDKVLSSGATARCDVEVFALEVHKQKSSWPERKRRERRWVSPQEAAGIVGDAELAPLIRRFAETTLGPEPGIPDTNA